MLKKIFPGTTANQWHVLLGTWLGGMFDGLDSSIYVITLYPALSELLQTTSHAAVSVAGSYVLALFLIGWACGAIFFGILADYIGRTRTMLITILLYSACTGLCGLTHTWPEMALCRFLVGFGIGGELSIGAVLLAESWSGLARTHVMSIMCSSYAFGYLLTAMLNLTIGSFGWRPLYFVGILPALLTVYVRAKIKESDQFELVAAQRKYLKQTPKKLISTADAQLTKFTFLELFHGANLRNTLLILSLSSTAIVGYWAVVAWIPAWINQITGTAAVVERSYTTFATNLGSITSALLGGFIVAKLGCARTFRFGFGGSLVSCALMYLSIKSFGAPLLITAFIVGFFVNLPFIALFVYAPEQFPVHIRGTAFGFSIQLSRFAAAAAVVTGGQLISLFGGSYALAGSCLSLVYLLGVVASFFLPRGRSARSAEVVAAAAGDSLFASIPRS